MPNARGRSAIARAAAKTEDNSAALVHFRLADEYERRVRDSAPVVPIMQARAN
jgi:hypothetical protein